MIYFVGDLHFGHSNILEYEKETRGKYWNSVEEMNEGLIKLWNETITKDDIVSVSYTHLTLPTICSV